MGPESHLSGEGGGRVRADSGEWARAGAASGRAWGEGWQRAQATGESTGCQGQEKDSF